MLLRGSKRPSRKVAQKILLAIQKLGIGVVVE